MKTLKRIASVFLAAAFVLCTMMTSAFAVEVTEPDKYTAYEIFSGDVLKEVGEDSTSRVLANVQWGESIVKDGTNHVDALISALLEDSKSESASIKTAFAKISEAISKAQEEKPDAKASEVVTAADVAEAFSSISGDEKAAARLALIVYANVIEGSGTVVTDGYGIDPGYYLVVDETDDGEAKNPNLLQVISEKIRITDKVSTPTITKQVYESDLNVDSEVANEDGYNDYASYKINDTVDYRLNITIPDALTNYQVYKMVIHDVMDAGLTFKSDSVKVYINKTVTTPAASDDEEDTTETVSTELKSDSYVLGTSGTHRFKITMDDIRSLKDKDGNAIDAADGYTTFTVEFKATLNQNATTGKSNPNENKVWLCYTNDPNSTSSGTTVPGTDPENPEDKDNPKDYPDTPEEEKTENKDKGDDEKNPEDDDDLSHTTEDIVAVYTYALTITKEDSKDSTKKLSGATFTMKQGTTAMTFTKVETTTDPADSNNGEQGDAASSQKNTAKTATTDVTYYYDPNGDVTELVTDDNGQIKIVGLESDDSGKYTLEETVAPNGYHKLDGAITLELESNIENEVNTYVGKNEYTDDGSAKTAVSTVTLKKGNESVSTDDGNGVLSITITNVKGSPLPETGGMGTAIFYTVGGALVIAAGIYLVMKKRHANA